MHQPTHAQLAKILRMRAFHRQLGICIYCQSPISLNATIEGDKLSAAHIIPKRNGGKLRDNNIAAAHVRCNTTFSTDLQQKSKKKQ